MSASSSASSFRRSIGSIVSKIASRNSLDVNGDEIKQLKTSNLPCYVCGKKAKKNFQCRTCSKITCLSDSGVTSLSNTIRTCDNCIRLNLVNELSCNDIAKEKISIEIQDLVTKRDASTKLLNKESGKVRVLQNELKESLDQITSAKSKITKKLNLIQQENKNLEKDINNWNIENSKIKTINERDENTLNEILKEAEHYKVAVDEMVKERTRLLSNLNELRDFIRLQVPIRIIKKIICFNCYITVQNAFASLFKHIAPIKAESVIKEQPKKQGACASCDIF